MKSAAKIFFDSLNNYSNLNSLIDEGQTENFLLECKTVSSVNLNNDVKMHLAKIISAFSNTNGGVIVYGLATDKKKNTEDIIVDIEDIGNCNDFAKRVEKNIPLLVSPTIFNCEVKVILKKKKSNCGVVVIYVPFLGSSPVQSNLDNKFYYRSGEESVIAPYDMIKRLFLATEGPSLRVVFNSEIFKKDNDGWEIPFSIHNESHAVARDWHFSVEILNSSDCNITKSIKLTDNSHINPGRKIFMKSDSGVIHMGLGMLLGSLKITMSGKLKKLQIKTSLYADKMEMKEQFFNIYLNTKNCRIKEDK